MQLATRFASRSPVLRSEHPLSDDQIRAVAPSIFADGVPRVSWTQYSMSFDSRLVLCRAHAV